MKSIKLVFIFIALSVSSLANASFITNDDIDVINVYIPDGYTLDTTPTSSTTDSTVLLFDGVVQRKLSKGGTGAFRVTRDEDGAMISDDNAVFIEIELNRLVNIKTFSIFNDGLANPNEQVTEIGLKLLKDVEILFMDIFNNFYVAPSPTGDGPNPWLEQNIANFGNGINGVNKILIALTDAQNDREIEIRELRFSIQEYQVSAPAAGLLFVASLLFMLRRKK
jgi:hypothetical protein